MTPVAQEFRQNILNMVQPALPGLLLAVLTLLFGFGVGITFGLNEDLIKSQLSASAMEVKTSAYHDSDKEMKTVLDKSWTYMKRAHLHAGALGASALGLILLLSLISPKAFITRWVSIGLGLGGLGYSVFWLLAGFRAPGLGSTSAAKESLKWLAQPTSGAFVICTAIVAFLIIWTMFKNQKVRN